ncbi:MAG: OprD family outer membrane porin [Flavobacteriales bacterium]
MGILLNSHAVFAQQIAKIKQPHAVNKSSRFSNDSSSLYYAFKTGVTNGQMRYFLSQTTNEGALTDYYANALGGGLRFETNSFHHFQLAFGGFYIFNLGSSNFTQKDPLTGLSCRYEIGLFDIENPGHFQHLGRQEELYLKYNLKQGKLLVGRQFIQTPLINTQDGRMRGNLVEGLWVDHFALPNLRFQGGLLSSISPRSTTRWFRGAESIGLYGQGVNPDGSPAQYKGNLNLPFIAVASLSWKPSNDFTYQGWDYHLPGILNCTFHQLNLTRTLGKINWANGGQLLREWALGEGGNVNQQATYISKGAKALTFGFKSELQFSKWNFSLNYNRITSEGRFLFPREWGRDPFFTFMPRERNEGFGDVHAFAAKFELQNQKSVWRKSGISIGYFQLPDVKDFVMNKYGVPSYLQANLDVKMKMDHYLPGLEGQLLMACKYGLGNTYGNPKYEFNKVNMLLTNFVLSYHF